MVLECEEYLMFIHWYWSIIDNNGAVIFEDYIFAFQISQNIKF